MLRLAAFSLLAVALVAFDAPVFKYGCNVTHCQYQFVVPEEVAGYVDQKVLKSDVDQLTKTVTTLDANSKNLTYINSDAFAAAFNLTYAADEPTITNTATAVGDAVPQFASANDTATILNNNAQQIGKLANCLINADRNQSKKNSCLANNNVPSS